VIVNGFFTDTFQAHRGVRQGCSLSPLLYILCLEPLLTKFRSDRLITGFLLPGEETESRVVAYADDVNLVLKDEPSVRKALGLVDIFGLASGSKLNFLKSFGVWLGSWADRRDAICNLNFPQDARKFYGVLLERGHIARENWVKVLSKFSDTLFVCRKRNTTMRGRAVLANSMAASKLWYIATVFNLPNDLLKSFNFRLFKFIWKGVNKTEWIGRSILVQDTSKGGLGLVDIGLKAKCLQILHVRNIILGQEVKWFSIARYFLGFRLRQFNSNLYSVSKPHEIFFVPPFYESCLASLREFLKIRPNPDWEKLTVKSVYDTFINFNPSTPVVERKFPLVNFNLAFRNASSAFLCPNLRELNWKIIHQILPLNSLLYRYHVLYKRKTYLCCFCKNLPDTLNHLFINCTYIRSFLLHVQNILKIVSQNIPVNAESILFLQFSPPTFSAFFHLVLSVYKHTIYYFRNILYYEKKFHTPQDFIAFFNAYLKTRMKADFFRLNKTHFTGFWPPELFKIENENLVCLL
jgi:hypothetical protein